MALVRRSPDRSADRDEGGCGVQREAGRNAAFTITELLAACAIMGLLSVILFSALNQITRVTSIAQGNNITCQDVRTVLEQMAREIQQTIPYESVGVPNIYPFKASGSALHFVASIDNNTGHEEAEVHYVYDGSNILYKAVAFSSDVANWDFDSASAWDTTPTISPLTSSTAYGPVLEGVWSISYTMWTNYPPTTANPSLTTDWPHTSYYPPLSTNSIPVYLKVDLQIYDPQVIRRWGSAALVTGVQTNLVRSFSTLILLPRSSQ